MSRYAVREIGVFAGAGGVLGLIDPSNMLAAWVAVSLTYLLLQLASAVAFCIALHKGLVREHQPAPYSYSVAAECKGDWLVMRHIWTYLRQVDELGRAG